MVQSLRYFFVALQWLHVLRENTFTSGLDIEYSFQIKVRMPTQLQKPALMLPALMSGSHLILDN
jgi:hypothetical protein